MISLVIGSAIAIAGLQATIAAPRAAFVACLKDAASKASTQKVGGDGFESFARTNCSGQAGGLKTALVGFDVKNGVARKQASSDADMQIDDYLATYTDSYKSRLPNQAPVATASAASNSAPVATASAAPK